MRIVFCLLAMIGVLAVSQAPAQAAGKADLVNSIAAGR
jgi:hypothetical protein